MKRTGSIGRNSIKRKRFRSTGSFGGMEEVIERNVLKFVPGKSLCRLKLLSKSWNTYISSKRFMASHMVAFKQVSGFFLQLPQANNPMEPESYLLSLDKRVYGIPDPMVNFLPERVLVMASTNGMVCCRGDVNRSLYYICNPLIREYKQLPPSMHDHGKDRKLILVYEPSVSKEFTPICTYPREPLQLKASFELYESAQGRWRTWKQNEINGLVRYAIYLKEMVYLKTHQANSIFALDLKREEISTMKASISSNAILGCLKNQLCITEAVQKGFDITVYNDASHVWEAKHVIDLSFQMKRSIVLCPAYILYVRQNRIVFRSLNGYVNLFDIESKEVIKLEFDRNNESFSVSRETMIQYVNSFADSAHYK